MCRILPLRLFQSIIECSCDIRKVLYANVVLSACPTTFQGGGPTEVIAQEALLADPTTSTPTGNAQKKEKDAAFDLLDALTKTGGLAVEHASLHVVIAATHCFDKTVLQTIVQDNVRSQGVFALFCSIAMPN